MFQGCLNRLSLCFLAGKLFHITIEKIEVGAGLKENWLKKDFAISYKHASEAHSEPFHVLSSVDF